MWAATGGSILAPPYAGSGRPGLPDRSHAPRVKKVQAAGGSGKAAARFQCGGRERRCRQWVSGVSTDLAEAIADCPVLAESDDLVMTAADEIPPHDDPLFERLAAEQQ